MTTYEWQHKDKTWHLNVHMNEWQHKDKTWLHRLHMNDNIRIKHDYIWMTTYTDKTWLHMNYIGMTT